MEYWLKHVDKQRAAAAAQKRNLYRPSMVGGPGDLLPVPTLPEKLTDPREATAAWIHEHRKIWIQMSRARAAARTQTLHQHIHPWLASPLTNAATAAAAAAPDTASHHHFLHHINEHTGGVGGLIDHILMAASSSSAPTATVRNKFASQHSSPRLLPRILSRPILHAHASSSSLQPTLTAVTQPAIAATLTATSTTQAATATQSPQPSQRKDASPELAVLPPADSNSRAAPHRLGGAPQLLNRLKNPFKKNKNDGSESRFSNK